MLFILLFFFRDRHTLRRVKYLLSAAVMASAVFLPAAAQTNAEPEIHLGTGDIKNPPGSGRWSYVYYGTNPFDSGRPLKYRVLNNFENAFSGSSGPRTMLLDCDSIIHEIYYGDNKKWAGSVMREYLNSTESFRFLTGMTAAEQDAIAVSNKTGKMGGDGDGVTWLDFAPVENDRIFLLDAKEVTNFGYGYLNGDDGVRIKNNPFTEDPNRTKWYLRSPHNEYNAAGLIGAEGEFTTVDLGGEPVSYGISPAFNIKVPSVIFSSAVDSDKKEYKLTVQDDEIKVAKESLSINGGEITISYKITGSHAGNVTRVIALITDNEFSDTTGWKYKPQGDHDWQLTEIKQQDVAENSGTEGTLKLTVELFGDNQPLYFEKWDKSFFIYVIAEAENTGTATNYASKPLKIDRPEHVHDWSFSAEGNTITAKCNAPLHSGGDAKFVLHAPSDGRVDYDGEPHAAEPNAYNDVEPPIFDPENTEITYYRVTEEGPVLISDTPVNAGTYMAEATVYGQTVSVTYLISPRSVSIKSKDQTIYIGGHIKNGPEWVEIYQETPLLEGHKLNAIDLTVDGSEIKVVRNSAQIVDEQGNDVTDNYLVFSSSSGTLTVLDGKTYQVTFIVENGRWNDKSSADKFDEVGGPPDAELKLSESQIPAVGNEPDEHYQAGSWDPALDTVIEKDTAFTYKYERIPVSYEVTFKVVNGRWDDGNFDDKTIKVSGYEGETVKLTAAQIPEVGNCPDENYDTGSWDPALDTEITDDNKVFTYTYTRIPVSYPVTFKVVNGMWDDGNSDDRTVTLSGYKDETLTLSSDLIPAAGNEPDEHYQAGSWDTEPDTVTAITGETVYTYIYERIPVIYQVTFKVVNGIWDDGSSDDKTIDVSGYEAVPAKLPDDRIPVVGNMPDENYDIGSWEPALDTEFSGDAVFTYTYSRIPVSYQVTFKVVNGQWDDDEEYAAKTVRKSKKGDNSSVVRIVTLSGYKDEDLFLSAEQIPAVGGKPDAGYTAGSWDKTPDTETAITGDTVFTYTYAEDQRPAIRYQVTFIVVNGRWNDGSSENKIVILSGYEEDILKLTAAQIPGAGNEPDEHYKAGSWDTTPDTETAITGDTVFTYTYAGEDEPVDPPCPCCCDCILPPTGFSASWQTVLPEQPKELRYTPSGMRLMIPTLDVDSELVTVPLNGNTWSVEWLGSQSGILEGSALPGRGLSLIAAHNSLNEAESGPFALVSLLEPNDVIAVKGKRNDLEIFRVFANELLATDDMKRVHAVAGREDNTLVLITCENESAEGGYLNRRVIFAKPAE